MIPGVLRFGGYSSLIYFVLCGDGVISYRQSDDAVVLSHHVMLDQVMTVVICE